MPESPVPTPPTVPVVPVPAPVGPSGPKAVPPPSPVTLPIELGTPLSTSPAMQRSRASLRQRFGAEPKPPPAKVVIPAGPVKAGVPAKAPEMDPVRPGEAPKAADGAETAPTPVKVATEVVAPTGKTSPWKLVESFKSQNKQLKTELAELQAKTGNPELLTLTSKRAEAAEARLKELESEIQFVNYEKSAEFKEKYEQPFQKAWTKALHDVTQLVVTDETGTQRPATAGDLWAVINLPLGEATRRAKELFGDDLGTYVMSHHYGKIRDLSDAQTEALEKARKDGSQREQELSHQSTIRRSEVAHIYQRLRDEDAKKFPFLQEIEGDDGWNGKLAFATNFVDTTMATSVVDPQLTAEQRAEAIGKHVAVRNRAIGFSMVKLENKRLKSELAERDKELAEFKESQPGDGDGRVVAEGAPVLHGAAKQRSILTLRNLAK